MNNLDDLSKRVKLAHKKNYTTEATDVKSQEKKDDLSKGVKLEHKRESSDYTSERRQQRRVILEVLKEPYEKDIMMWVHNSELAEKTNITDYNELHALVEDLCEKGFIDIPVRAAGEFAARLNEKGLLSLQKGIFDS